MTRKHVVSALCVFALLGLLAACVQGDNPTPVVEERSPFSVDVRGGDGTVVSLDAYSDGYLPGGTDTVRLAVTNNTDQPWNGRVCLQMLEPAPSIVVRPLAEEAFDLPSGDGFQRDVQFDLPAELAPGTYGLALVIHTPTGPGTSVTAVLVGEGEREAFQGDWSWTAATEACPAP